MKSFMNTGLTSLFCVYVCIQVNPYFIPQKHQSSEEPGIHARAVAANADTYKTFGSTHRKKEDTVARSEKKEYTNSTIFHLLSVKQNPDQKKNLVLKCNQLLD